MNANITANGKPVTERMFKLVQAYMLAVLVGNKDASDYFANQIAKEDAKA